MAAPRFRTFVLTYTDGVRQEVDAFCHQEARRMATRGIPLLSVKGKRRPSGTIALIEASNAHEAEQKLRAQRAVEEVSSVRLAQNNPRTYRVRYLPEG